MQMFLESNSFTQQVSNVLQCYTEEGSELYNDLTVVPLQSVVFMAQSDFNMLNSITIGLSFVSTFANSISLECNYPLTREQLASAINSMQQSFPQLHFCCLIEE